MTVAYMAKRAAAAIGVGIAELASLTLFVGSITVWCAIASGV